MWKSFYQGGTHAEFGRVAARVVPAAHVVDLVTVWFPADNGGQQQHLFTYGRVVAEATYTEPVLSTEYFPAKIARWSMPVADLLAAVDVGLVLPDGEHLELDRAGGIHTVNRHDQEPHLPWRTHALALSSKARDIPRSFHGRISGRRRFQSGESLITEVMEYPLRWAWGTTGCVGLTVLVEDRRGKQSLVKPMAGRLTVGIESGTGAVPSAVEWHADGDREGVVLERDPNDPSLWATSLAAGPVRGTLIVEAALGDVCDEAVLETEIGALQEVDIAHRTGNAGDVPLGGADDQDALALTSGTPVSSTGGAAPKILTNWKFIASGGLAGVWKAHDPVLGRDVAVKVFLPTQMVILGALDHARALARVRHPNVVVVHDVARVKSPTGHGEVVDGVVMELLEGETLDVRLRGRQFSSEEARGVGLSILKGLSAIHGSGLIHGDLHAGNVMLDPHVAAKVIDIHYLGTFTGLPTATRDQRLLTDVMSTRTLLYLILQHSEFALDVAADFRQAVDNMTELQTVQDAFTRVLETARMGSRPGHTEVDRNTARRLWGTLNSRWLADWYSSRMNYPQYEEDRWLDPFMRYVRLPEQPEFRFDDPVLRGLHGALIAAIHSYMKYTGTEMVVSARGRYVISTKVSENLSREKYDEQYERQVNGIYGACQAIKAAWDAYATKVNRCFPDVADDQSYPPRDLPTGEDQS